MFCPDMANCPVVGSNFRCFDGLVWYILQINARDSPLLTFLQNDRISVTANHPIPMLPEQPVWIPYRHGLVIQKEVPVTVNPLICCDPFKYPDVLLQSRLQN